MNSLNKAEADAEMKALISEAYTNQTLWTTDWAGVQLKAWVEHDRTATILKFLIDSNPKPQSSANHSKIYLAFVGQRVNSRHQTWYHRNSEEAQESDHINASGEWNSAWKTQATIWTRTWNRKTEGFRDVFCPVIYSPFSVTHRLRYCQR